jgi:hypothetical protein
VPVEDPRIQSGMKLTEDNMQNRLAETLSICQGVMVCEADTTGNVADRVSVHVLASNLIERTHVSFCTRTG